MVLFSLLVIRINPKLKNKIDEMKLCFKSFPCYTFGVTANTAGFYFFLFMGKITFFQLFKPKKN